MSINNSSTITGNVVRDPELRFTSTGTGVLTLGVAVNNRYPDRANPGKFLEDVSFFDCVVWNEMALHVAESVHKGDRVTVTGRLRQRSWETDGGDKRYAVEIVTEDVAVSLRFGTTVYTKLSGNLSGASADELVEGTSGAPLGVPFDPPPIEPAETKAQMNARHKREAAAAK